VLLIILVVVGLKNFNEYDCDKPLTTTGNLAEDSMAQSIRNLNCRKN